MNLSESVGEIKGIGPKTQKILEKAGIRTVRDFFYNLPRDYENFRAPRSIGEMRPGRVLIKGRISRLTTRHAKSRNLSITEGVVKDNTGVVHVVWFNQTYRERQLLPHREYYFNGVYELKNGRYQLTAPDVTLTTDIDVSSGIMPIYASHGKLKTASFKRFIKDSRDKFAEIPDLIPMVKPKTRSEALFKVHFPNTMNDTIVGRNYLAYEELFELVLAAKLNKNKNSALKSIKIAFDVEKIRDFVGKLPFALTNAQRVAAWEIFQDMEKEHPMNRLLQGDVGSGKTMVAAMAAYEAIVAGFQVAILAPTTILANQHYDSLSKLLTPFGVNVALLTGDSTGKAELRKDIKNGKIDLVIGTHAILTDSTEFNNLALAIIDEQHRFGVQQRQKLIEKSPDGFSPHLLSMTATPIPRSLQLTVLGDLDVSILNELPKGRQPIETHIMPEIETREKLYPKIRETIKNGQQVYWICKSIKDGTLSCDDFGSENFWNSEKITKGETTSVKYRTEKLRRVMPELTIEYLHGKMKPEEKDDIMERFARGEIQILVSTTVVEVGVDVPNSTLMVIENAESYGLAQLHQLRGRVGRGSVKSYCFLLTAGDMKPSERLREVESSSDGFHLAEVDLKLRGPGEIYGSLQHGALDLRFASVSDTKLVRRVQDDVEKFLQTEPNFDEYEELRSGIQKYQQLTRLN